MREPEPETIEAARRGDEDAFESLVRAFLADVYRLAWHMVRDRQTAEDVSQETFLNAYRALPRFRLGEKFSTWIFHIARNCAIDAIRRRRRHDRLKQTPPAESPVVDVSLRVTLHAAIDELPDELREAFVVVEIFGFTYPEAGKILGTPVGTLKSRMHRARKLLVSSLHDEEDAGEV